MYFPKMGPPVRALTLSGWSPSSHHSPDLCPLLMGLIRIGQGFSKWGQCHLGTFQIHTFWVPLQSSWIRSSVGGAQQPELTRFIVSTGLPTTVRGQGWGVRAMGSGDCWIQSLQNQEMGAWLFLPRPYSSSFPPFHFLWFFLLFSSCYFIVSCFFLNPPPFSSLLILFFFSHSFPQNRDYLYCTNPSGERSHTLIWTGKV